MLLCGPEALLSLLPPRGGWRTLSVGEGVYKEGGDAASERLPVSFFDHLLSGGILLILLKEREKKERK